MGYETITDAKFGFEDFKENGSGIAEKAYLIPISWILAEQKPVASTTSKSLVEIATAHTMITGKAPIQVVPLFDKSGAASEGIGQMLSRMFKPTAKFFMPQISADNLGTLTMLKNTRFMVLVERSSGGDLIQIGTGKLPAYIINSPVSLGEGGVGEVGISLDITVSASIVPFYFYKGVVPVLGV
jgi:hypothetical protein